MFGPIETASMVGFTLLSRSYYYLRRRSPGPPFPPDHRQAGERGAINVAPYCHRIVQCSEYVEVTAICSTICAISPQYIHNMMREKLVWKWGEKVFVLL
jgi:hypothetical protein